MSITLLIKERFDDLKNNKLFSCVLGFLLLATAIVSIHIFQIQSYSRIDILDVDKIVHDFSYNLSQNKNLNENQKKMMANEFSPMLKNAINFYADEHHVMIINKNSILSNTGKYKEYEKKLMGHKNITPIIENQIQNYLIAYFKQVVSKKRADASK